MTNGFDYVAAAFRPAAFGSFVGFKERKKMPP
jgi:hypothetical protein